MTDTILVSSTRPGTGKTGIAIALAAIAQQRGHSVGYTKPKGTKLQSSVGKTLDKDPVVAREVLGLDDELHEMEPIVYSPTFVDDAVRGREDPDELRDRVVEAHEGIAADRDLVVVEGGDTHATGGVVELDDAALADLLDAETVLVAGYDEMRDLDAVLAAADALDESLVGVLFNAVADADFDAVQTAAAPFLERRGVPVRGALPRRLAIAGVTVADLQRELSAVRLTDAEGEGYVERFLVGAMGAESALAQFRRTKDAVVVTGGDRPEIQRAAIEAPGVRAVVLTEGQEPPGAVISAAEDRGVPLLLVDGDTLDTIDRLERLIQGGRVPDADTVDLIADLLRDHSDAPDLLPG